ncbi:hypothetical protein P171DRAFT_432011 [Karstenula rhodostoma CBS 690.94]|uniref:Rhodopsin domain-containing protein n=1 Tax=Karstenula rhodostoma CBS 690.94 TaxID=1392251 RepID=A0A9P4PGW7_9PLEO|nr:hypothetical protein P171DRAFT_432011 [Karstenula rhodostoma CBS 690.94]
MADQVVVSASNRTPVVQIATWFGLVVSVLAFFSHAGVKVYISRSLTVETGFVFLALLFGSAQAIAVSLQASNGFGKPSSSLDNEQLQIVLKSGYAAVILFFFSIAFSKLAIVAFIHGLTPKKLDRHFNYAIGAFSIVWLVVAVFIAAFQCRLPHPWDKISGRCIDNLHWWETITIIGIVSEVALVALEMGIIAPLQMARQRKVFLISLLTCRLFVSIAAAVQLYFFHKDTSGPLRDDYALGYWRSTICNQIVQCLAIVTTSLPYTKIFMKSFESGMIGAERSGGKTERSTEGSGPSGRGWELLDVSRSSATRPIDGISKTQTFTVESTRRA